MQEEKKPASAKEIIWTILASIAIICLVCVPSTDVHVSTPIKIAVIILCAVILACFSLVAKIKDFWFVVLMVIFSILQLRKVVGGFGTFDTPVMVIGSIIMLGTIGKGIYDWYRRRKK